tara:strand:- start:8506 stop:8673 length:168 start_codon:yes stop_codon:yes gene_type:complete
MGNLDKNHADELEMNSTDRRIRAVSRSKSGLIFPPPISPSGNSTLPLNLTYIDSP